jgi:hypothetical protein
MMLGTGSFSINPISDEGFQKLQKVLINTNLASGDNIETLKRSKNKSEFDKKEREALQEAARHYLEFRGCWNKMIKFRTEVRTKDILKRIQQNTESLFNLLTPTIFDILCLEPTPIERTLNTLLHKTNLALKPAGYTYPQPIDLAETPKTTVRTGERAKTKATRARAKSRRGITTKSTTKSRRRKPTRTVAKTAQTVEANQNRDAERTQRAEGFQIKKQRERIPPRAPERKLVADLWPIYERVTGCQPTTTKRSITTKASPFLLFVEEFLVCVLGEMGFKKESLTESSIANTVAYVGREIKNS